ncbi:phage portal protein [Burkholderia multivorans]|uniref:phage portal protein n=1 Tax=Burkholderia multivorans TaxID=87883 RepID=UPI000CFF83CB|nr:phage portal protein [Burkholderia multivorans]PRF87230.1 phage portal protein [Burkholderia multivorans]
MSRKYRRGAARRIRDRGEQAADTSTAEATRAEVFSFGDPIAVLDRRELLDYVECMRMGNWYEPPLPLDGLARSFRAAPHHSSAIYVKRNILVQSYIEHPLLTRADFSRFVLEYLVFANSYLELRTNRLGQPMALKCSLAKYTRVGVEPGQYWFVTNVREPHAFPAGAVYHLYEPDLNQEIYGLPEYLSALNSTWLNESATLFRRRYYKNGSHAGFILYMTDAAEKQEDVDNLREALRNAKGPGNFRNLFMYAPKGKKDGIQLLPIGEVAAKDEFWNIKKVTVEDQLAAHRVPPQLMGIIPSNAGGFGDVHKAAEVFNELEIEPLKARLREVNDWLGIEVVRFRDFEPAKG